MKLNVLPGDHLLLLVGGVTAAAQVLIGRGEEVERVVLEVLVDEREENLEGDIDNDKIRSRSCKVRLKELSLYVQQLCLYHALTLAKNLISCS